MFIFGLHLFPLNLVELRRVCMCVYICVCMCMLVCMCM